LANRNSLLPCPALPCPGRALLLAAHPPPFLSRKDIPFEYVPVASNRDRGP
jgi:hypothetical protein